MRWVGWNLNKIVQTGSNFGLDQRHENPFLCDIGSGTMVSDGLKMINMHDVGSSFKLAGQRSATTTIWATTSHYPSTAAPARTACSAPRP